MGDLSKTFSHEECKSIYTDIIMLFRNPKWKDKRFFGYKMAFGSKMASFEFLLNMTKEKARKLEKVAQEEIDR